MDGKYIKDNNTTTRYLHNKVAWNENGIVWNKNGVAWNENGLQTFEPPEPS